MKTLRKFGGVLILMTMFLIGCAEDTKTADMRVKVMTNSDNSQIMTNKSWSSISEINLDIRRCEMYYSRPDYGWFALPSHVGVYNLLSLRENTLLLVQNTRFPQGIITQFRWWLGPDNSVTISGTRYPLRVLNTEESALKINLKSEIRFDHNIEIRFIFDTNNSTIEQMDGMYVLNAVIQVEVINQD